MIRIDNTGIGPGYDYNKIHSKIDLLLMQYLKIQNNALIQYSKKRNINKTTNITRVLSYIQANLKSILNGLPSDLKKHIVAIENIDIHVRKSGRDPSNINKLMKFIFIEKCYDSQNYDKKDIVFNKFEFIEKLGLNSCPYCNRNYITTTKKNKLKQEIDHFFPKAEYPYLAISYYNLIPSCKFCNQQGIKGTCDTYNKNVVSPYEIKNNDFKFTFSIKKLNAYDCINSNNKISVLFDKKIPENDECFKLEELYQEHTDIVLELICKKIHYPKSYINELSKFGFSTSEIYRFLLCNYRDSKDFHKRPFSKLVRDISDELKLI